jgi:hypothetical protein
MKNEIRVSGHGNETKYFDNMDDAKRHAFELRASLPEDAENGINIEIMEEGINGQLWIPVA